MSGVNRSIDSGTEKTVVSSTSGAPLLATQLCSGNVSKQSVVILPGPDDINRESKAPDKLRTCGIIGVARRAMIAFCRIRQPAHDQLKEGVSYIYLLAPVRAIDLAKMSLRRPSTIDRQYVIVVGIEVRAFAVVESSLLL